MGKALQFCRVGGSAAVEPKSLDLVGPVLAAVEQWWGGTAFISSSGQVSNQ
jgi:hypothetical protein